MWAGIAILSLVVSLVVNFVPPVLTQLLWPAAVVVPAMTSYMRARRQDWIARSRRGVVVNVVMALVIAGAMLTFQFGRAEGDAVARFQLNAALIVAVGQPAWLLWSLYDSLMLFLQERRRRPMA
jgi:hypothetical protein